MLQGVPIRGSIDLTDLGVFSDVQFELYNIANKSVVAMAKYLTPSTGQYQVTKVGNVYSFMFPSAVTLNLMGNFGIEMTYFDSLGVVIDKVETTETISIEQEAR